MTTHGSLPSPEEKASAVRSMFDAIAPRYDVVNRIMTFGLDIGWRRRAVEMMQLPAGSWVADVACGTGDFCRELEKAGHKPIGFDVSAGMLREARVSAPLVQADGLRLPLSDSSVEGVTCGFALRNVVDIGDLFDEFERVLKPGGALAVLEVAQPDSKLLRTGHHVYFHKVVPLIGGLLSDRSAYRYLPNSTAYLPATSTLLEMLLMREFHRPALRYVGLGAAQIITAVRA
jgi:demethylmenaquinone methyltransferase/2-methoxy-6-polyprenyl-1,4-benzoquinol methylase